MAFVSFEYAAFVALLLPIYFRLSLRGQNLLLLATSFGFIAAADPRDAVVMAVGTCVDFVLCRGLAWEQPDRVRRRALWGSVCWNIGLLASFKYGPTLGGWLGAVPAHGKLHTRAWLPLGLSFYTLQRLSHALDAYFRVLRPCTNLRDYALFSAFFPLLSSGPIERAKNLLPRFSVRRSFELERFYEGCWLFSLGLWKKVYIADHMALAVKDLLTDSASGGATLIGMYAYAFQLYADFAGYSDMARGSARLFGIDVLQNFEQPYFSTSIAEYWQRWHVSLSSFLDDYVYKPTAMLLRARPTASVLIATFVTFGLSALWHGTGWMFMAWGCLHAFGLSVYALTRKQRKRLKKKLPASVMATLSGLVTFHYVVLGYVFFRSRTLHAALATLAQVGRGPLLSGPHVDWAGELALYAGLLFVADLLHRRSGPFWVLKAPVWARVLCYATMIVCALRFHAPPEDFIYADF